MIGEQPHPKRCFIISEEDFEKFAQQMIVTFPFMPDPVRKEWADRIKRVRASRISAGEPAPYIETLVGNAFQAGLDKGRTSIEQPCQCSVCPIEGQEAHDKRIRADERAKVLKEVYVELITTHLIRGDCVRDAIKVIESLRSKP